MRPCRGPATGTAGRAQGAFPKSRLSRPARRRRPGALRGPPHVRSARRISTPYGLRVQFLWVAVEALGGRADLWARRHGLPGCACATHTQRPPLQPLDVRAGGAALLAGDDRRVGDEHARAVLIDVVHASEGELGAVALPV